MADNANLKSQYLAQIEADLERTDKEKERLSTDLTALQEQLATLEQDHVLLVGVRQALVDTSPATAQASEPAPADVPAAAVPRPRKPKAAPRTPKQPAAKTKAPSASGTGTSTSTSTSGSSHAPTLVELVTAYLTGHSEPRSAAEVATALTQAHPDRKIQTTVVRNTLEGLVAKGQGQRSRQGRSVYYATTGTAPAPDTTAESAATTA